MFKKVNWIATDQNVTVNYDGQTHIVPRTDGLATRLIEVLKKKEYDKIPELVTAAERIKKFSDGQFTVQGETIYVNGVAAPAALSRKILSFSNEGLPCEPLINFTQRLQKNPSFRAVNELYSFLEKNDHPITEDGHFIAYKRVRSDFKDIHSGTFDNSPGTFVEMPRNQVNEDATQTCSYGLHVANWDYAHNHFASSNSLTDKMLEVEVDPADVVAVPVDYDNAKMRVCAYKVLGVVDKEHSSEVQLRRTRIVDDLNTDTDEDNYDSEENSDDSDDSDDDRYYADSNSPENSSDEEIYTVCTPVFRDPPSVFDDNDSYPWEEELD